MSSVLASCGSLIGRGLKILTISCLQFNSAFTHWQEALAHASALTVHLYWLLIRGTGGKSALDKRHGMAEQQ